MLRLDLIAAVGVSDDGLPAHIYMAHLIPPNIEGKAYKVLEKALFHQLSLNLSDLLLDIDRVLSLSGGDRG